MEKKREEKKIERVDHNRAPAHIHRIEKKLRKFERYVASGKMSAATFATRKERMLKEIAYCTGKLQRGVVNYASEKKEEFGL